MSIKIIKSGIVTTLQDLGRSGFRNIGIGSGGAMDSFALIVANYLAGNDEGAAVMEINFPAPEILFRQDALISLTGADFSATINSVLVPMWTPLLVKKNSLLKWLQPGDGARSYLAVKNGWKAEKWLNSCSTHLKVGAGGYQGRALQKDDILSFATPHFAEEDNEILPWQISKFELNKIYEPSNAIRCLPGVEWHLLDEPSKLKFEKNDFVVSGKSDSMGYRLNSEVLLLQQKFDLISSAVDAGMVQLLPDGNCIILMADHQTTGGYPRIASVIKADLPKLAQVKPGQSVNFTMVSIQDAETIYLAILQVKADIKTSCYLNLNRYFKN